ncbi:unnamed protein product [Amaranthus hypochondriacus]
MQPLVMLLQVHPPDNESICSNPSKKLANVVHYESKAKTVLIEFFAYNVIHPLETKYCFQSLWSTMFGLQKLRLGTNKSIAR